MALTPGASESSVWLSTAASATSIGAHERAILEVFIQNEGRIVSRLELSRQAGLAELNTRRCDSLLVTLRRILGQDAIITVRQRGWMLAEQARALAASLL